MGTTRLSSFFLSYPNMLLVSQLTDLIILECKKWQRLFLFSENKEKAVDVFFCWKTLAGKLRQGIETNKNQVGRDFLGICFSEVNIDWLDIYCATNFFNLERRRQR